MNFNAVLAYSHRHPVLFRKSRQGMFKAGKKRYTRLTKSSQLPVMFAA